MAIYRIFKTGVFEPEAIAIMSAAYEDALRVLKLTDRQDPITEIVAAKIVQVSRAGEGDPIRIRELALQSLGMTPTAQRRARQKPAGVLAKGTLPTPTSTP